MQIIKFNLLKIKMAMNLQNEKIYILYYIFIIIYTTEPLMQNNALYLEYCLKTLNNYSLFILPRDLL